MSRKGFFSVIDDVNALVKLRHGTHFSIGTSPYYAHQNGLALDIYDTIGLEDYEAISPIKGKILEIREMLAPKPKFPEGIDKEYLIIVENNLNPELVYKTLHVKPQVKVGEKIDIGDILGKTVRNGYFAPFSSPHIHLEVRPKKDAIRARGGTEFSLAIDKQKKAKVNHYSEREEKLMLHINEVNQRFVLATLEGSLYGHVPPFYGISAEMGNLPCIMDGGIPHYNQGILITPNISPNFIGNSVQFFKKRIGEITNVSEILGFIKLEPLEVYIGDKKVRGISLYLSDHIPLLKIIPFQREISYFQGKKTLELKIKVNAQG